MQHPFYTFELDGQRLDIECDTRSQAMDCADEWWEERAKDGGEWEATGHIVKCAWDDETGETTDLEREEYGLIYEPSRTDYEQHNTHWGL